MIAVAFVLALVAAAQVQAFPGSDPATALLTTADQLSSAETFGLETFGANPICLVTYLPTLQKELKKGQVVLTTVQKAASEGLKRFQDCKGNADAFTCGCQAIRDTWEANEKTVVPQTQKFLEEAVVLAQTIYSKCLA